MKNISNYIIESQKFLINALDKGILNDKINKIKNYKIKKTIQDLLNQKILFSDRPSISGKPAVVIMSGSYKKPLCIWKNYICFGNTPPKMENNDSYIITISNFINKTFDEKNKIRIDLNFDSNLYTNKISEYVKSVNSSNNDPSYYFKPIFYSGAIKNHGFLVIQNKKNAFNFFNNLNDLLK